jgi:F-type H+-transporting ATPase subunit b
MLFDWFTVIAQALNFLILVWLMKRFLYKPILNAIDEREKRVSAELANADKKKAEAQKESDEFKHKNEEFDQQRAALLSKASDEAKIERQRLIDEAQKAAGALSLKWQETLRNDEHNLHQELSHRTQQEVFGIARKALTDLAGASLEERLSEVFIRRLKEMDGNMKAGLAQAVKTASDGALVRSAFDLSAEQRKAIQKALNENFSAEVRVRFEVAPDLISGIELTANGQKLSWSIADYISSMEKDVDEILKKNDKPLPKLKPEAKAEIKPEVKAELKPEAKAEPKPEVKAEPKPDAKPEAKAEPKPEAKVEPKPEDKTETKTETKAEPEPEAKVEEKPEVKAEPKPDAKSETKAEPKPETKSEPKPEDKTAPKTETKAEPEPEAKPEAKAVASTL